MLLASAERRVGTDSWGVEKDNSHVRRRLLYVQKGRLTIDERVAGAGLAGLVRNDMKCWTVVDRLGHWARTELGGRLVQAEALGLSGWELMVGA